MRPINEVQQKNNYNHLSEQQRIEIKTLKDHGKSQSYIARYIGCSQPTVSRELSRNAVENGRGKEVYKPGKAQLAYKDRRAKANLRHNFYMKHRELAGIVEKMLKQGHSPDIIANRILKKETKYMLSTSTIYNYIRYKKPLFRRYLLFKHGYKKHDVIKKPRICPNIPRIQEREEVVNNRSRIGDREADSIVSIGHIGGLTTLTERRSRLVLLKRAKRLDAETALYNMVDMLSDHKVETITTDNGSEFAFFDVVALRTGSLAYLCDPYCSWQKGSNEKNNREIRRYFPKKSDINNYTDQELQEIEDKINKKPRKILGYKSAYEVYYGKQQTYLN